MVLQELEVLGLLGLNFYFFEQVNNFNTQKHFKFSDGKKGFGIWLFEITLD